MNVIFTSAEEAEEVFYDAIGRADLDALMSVWADDEEIVCIHPTGQCLTGHLAVRESWRGILTNNPHLTVRIKRNVCWEGVETLYLAHEPTPHGPMLSTDVFHRGANGWRLLSRHASAAADSTTLDSTDSNSEPPEGGVRTLH